ncbi:MAG: fused MFS/spermidine synthase [Deltaproteobacteria bacterium]|nr:fused MFS/spermidine synthase [Deltaproteobacteria bacterium]
MRRISPRFFSACFLIIIPWSAVAWTGEEIVLYEGDSLYHHIRVSEQDGYRYLSFNRARGSQSKVSVSDPFDIQFPYTKAAFVVPAFLEGKPSKILLIGLGGGSIPRVMAKCYPDADIDIVEIDEDVITAAKDYFFFEPAPNMNISVMDGRRFLRSTREKYDIIFLDAYDDMSIPFHLTTREFFELVKDRLKKTGVVASNIWGPNTDKFFLSEVRTYQDVFPNVYMIDAVPSNNYILIACSQKTVISKTILQERTTSLQEDLGFDFPLSTYADTFRDLTGADFDVRVLIDDYAPVEVLRSKKASK